eukprot:COSAG03_NODE_18994_length_344_cov_1.020408_1_plen_114_part_11
MVLQTPHPGLPPARIFGLAYTSEQVVVESSVGIPGGAVTVSPKRTGASHWPRPLGAPWGNWSVDLDFGSVMPGKPFSITLYYGYATGGGAGRCEVQRGLVALRQLRLRHHRQRQ